MRFRNVEIVSGPNDDGNFNIYMYQSPVKGRIMLNIAKNAHRKPVFLMLWASLFSDFWDLKANIVWFIV